MKYNMWHLIKQYSLTLLIGIAIVILSFLNTSKVPSHNIWNYSGIDKLVHFIMYFTLGFFYFFEKYKYKKNKFLSIKLTNNIIPVITLIAIGGFIEIFQPALSNRSCEFFDFVANTIGVFGGFYAYKLFRSLNLIN